MRKLYLIPALAMAFAQLLYAQNPAGVMVTNSRLIGVSGDQWNNNQWNDYDTTALSYSGTRGGGYVDYEIVADSDVEQRWSWSGGALNNSTLVEKAYDANNNLAQLTKRNWISGNWSNYQRETLTYNSQGKNTVKTLESGTGTGPTDWEYSVRFTSTYDANGNLSTYQRDDWNGSSWGGYQKTINTHDASGNVLTAVLQTYSGGTWQNDSKSTYTYTAAGLMASYEYATWSGGAWVPYQRTNNTYNAQGNTTLVVVESYTGGTWMPFNRVTSSYNGQGHLVETISEDGVGSNWENSQRTTYVRNGQGLSTEQTLYNWQTATSTWREISRQTRTFDAAGNRLTEVSSYYVGGAWNDGYANTQTFNQYNQVTSRISEEDFGAGLQNTFRTYYYYEEYEDGTNGIGTIPTLASMVMPNPFTVNVAIQVTATEAGNHTFEVFNMAGQRVYTEERFWPAGQQTIVFEGQDLPKGVYFYKIAGAGGVAGGKLVKQ